MFWLKTNTKKKHHSKLCLPSNLWPTKLFSCWSFFLVETKTVKVLNQLNRFDEVQWTTWWTCLDVDVFVISSFTHTSFALFLFHRFSRNGSSSSFIVQSIVHAMAHKHQPHVVYVKCERETILCDRSIYVHFKMLGHVIYSI